MRRGEEPERLARNLIAARPHVAPTGEKGRGVTEAEMYGPLAEAFFELQAELQAAQEREQIDHREGVAEVYSHDGRYLGCIGEERWHELVAAQRTEEPSEKGACPSCGLNFGHEAGCPEEPSDDEGLEPIETSPLTEREPDL